MNDVKRRVLTKVRRQFLHKTPEDQQEPENYPNIPLIPEQLTQNDVRMLEPSIGLVEENRTICAGAHFYNSNFKITNMVVEHQPHSRAVVLGLQSNDMQSMPWEYCAKRLESYGNLELATWAQRIKEYHENYPKLVSRYFDMLQSNDTEVQANFVKAKAKAALACKEIESSQSYYKVTLFSNRTSTVPISASYSEGMLKEMGHTVESFVNCTRENGLPIVFHGDSPLHLEISRRFLGSNLLKGDLFQKGPEFLTFLYDREGSKIQVRIQLCLVMEPGAEGFFRSGYVIVRRVEEENKGHEGGEQDGESEKGDVSGKKLVKKDDVESANESNETLDTDGHQDGHSECSDDL